MSFARIFVMLNYQFTSNGFFYKSLHSVRASHGSKILYVWHLQQKISW